jgi:predicted  nucleic acid-binding Zn-ribbon protein
MGAACSTSNAQMEMLRKECEKQKQDIAEERKELAEINAQVIRMLEEVRVKNREMDETKALKEKVVALDTQREELQKEINTLTEKVEQAIAKKEEKKRQKESHAESLAELQRLENLSEEEFEKEAMDLLRGQVAVLRAEVAKNQEVTTETLPVPYEML